MLNAGCYADVVVFDPAKIQDHATFAKPHQYATGMVHVFVNGARIRERRTYRRQTGKVRARTGLEESSRAVVPASGWIAARWLPQTPVGPWQARPRRGLRGRRGALAQSLIQHHLFEYGTRLMR